MKLFASNIHIRTGEYEFDYPLMIEAKSQKDAIDYANNYAKNFYIDEDVETLDQDYEFPSYEFHCGCVIVNIDFVIEVKDEKEWLEKFEHRFKI